MRRNQNCVMAGLDPAISKTVAVAETGDNTDSMLGGWVYMMANRPDGVIYVGVTSDLPKRIWEHREALVEGFTKRYQLKRLVYFERHADILSAIQREKNIKHWPRAWKIALIEEQNPEWKDLYDQLV
jgi:putative endonuclease